MDLALIVDGSAIVTQSDPGDYRRFLAFLHDLVSRFDLRSGHTRVAAVVFGDVGQVVFYLDTFNTRVCGHMVFLKVLPRKTITASETNACCKSNGIIYILCTLQKSKNHKTVLYFTGNLFSRRLF